MTNEEKISECVDNLKIAGQAAYKAHAALYEASNDIGKMLSDMEIVKQLPNDDKSKNSVLRRIVEEKELRSFDEIETSNEEFFVYISEEMHNISRNIMLNTGEESVGAEGVNNRLVRLLINSAVLMVQWAEQIEKQHETPKGWTKYEDN